jgi:hypothetical protein
MKTITFPVGYRPHYLKQFLNSLSTQSITDYTIICSAENHAGCIKVLETCGIPMIILRKPESTGVRSHSGARDNMYNVLSYAFNNGSDFNVHLEDDFILSPDALDLANWYYETYKDKPMTYMCYGLFNWGSAGEDFSGVVEAPTFHGLGWCAFRKNWYACYDTAWFDDKLARKYANAYGWDWAVEGYFKEYKCKAILPTISRTYHVGRLDGTCCTVDFFDKTYVGLVWNQKERVKEFILREGVETKHIHP